MKPLKRYYDELGATDKALDLSALKRDMHALYTHWVSAHALRRDFTLAMEHAASLIYIEYWAQGAPRPVASDLTLVALTLAQVQVRPREDSPLRFFTEDCVINSEIDTRNHIPVLVPHFLRWVHEGYALRDFAQAVRDVSAVLVYDHEIAMSLGGLGGCRDSATFLSTAYAD